VDHPSLMGDTWGKETSDQKGMDPPPKRSCLLLLEKVRTQHGRGKKREKGVDDYSAVREDLLPGKIISC